MYIGAFHTLILTIGLNIQRFSSWQQKDITQYPWQQKEQLPSRSLT